MKMMLMKFCDVPVGDIFFVRNLRGVKISNHTVTNPKEDEPNFICLTEGRHYGHRCTISSKFEVNWEKKETFKT